MSDAGATCDHCNRDVVGRQVLLKLDGGHSRMFCSDACELRWMRDELVRMRRFLRRIWLTCRGAARELGRRALQTDDQP